MKFKNQKEGLNRVVHGSKVDLIIERKKDARSKKIHENLKVLRIRD